MPKKTRPNRSAGASARALAPTIAVFANAKTPLGLDLDRFTAAMQTFVTDHVAPVWGTPARLVRTKTFRPGAWAMVFLDVADEPDALAYHDLTPDGLPLSKVFVRTIADARASLTVAATHELVEMLVDPAVNLLTTGPDERLAYAYEVADPVEADALALRVGGFAMTDFVYPSYFETFHRPGSTRFDAGGHVRRPFQILRGGYQMVFRSGRWSNLGARAKLRTLAREDRRGHRCETRAVPLAQRQRSRGQA